MKKMAAVVENQGADITDEDMVLSLEESSKIQQFFAGTSVFVTGATGFLGKLMLEKLLRTCTEIEKVYILIREKKSVSVEKRYEEMLNSVLFDPLKRKNPKFADKITVLTGDCALPDLGLNNEDKQELIDNVSCVFHCAATVRFDQTIRTAAYINVRATMDLLALAKQMKKLKSFVYVSTAYSNCVRMEINEEFYQPTITGNNLLKLVEVLDDEMLNKITPALIGKWPNTYVFTKAVAEDVVKTQSKGLNAAVVRPSIVTGTMQEPLTGWIDNVYGATGVFLGAALGVIRTLHCDKDGLADMVPADYVINCTIAAAWDVATTNTNRKISNREGTDNQSQEESDIPPVFNYVSSVQKPITWEKTMGMVEEHLKQIPSPLQIWHYCFRLNSNYYVHYLFLIFLHRFPAYIVDFIARCIGKEPIMVEGNRKIEKFMDVLSYFATKTWRFQNDNVQALWKKLNVEDRKFFQFNMGAFDWETYVYSFSRGGRVYLLKDPLDTIPQGRVKYIKLQIAHYVLVGLLLLGFFKMMLMIWSAIF